MYTYFIIDFFLIQSSLTFPPERKANADCLGTNIHYLRPMKDITWLLVNETNLRVSIIMGSVDLNRSVNTEVNIFSESSLNGTWYIP